MCSINKTQVMEKSPLLLSYHNPSMDTNSNPYKSGNIHRLFLSSLHRLEQLYMLHKITICASARMEKLLKKCNIMAGTFIIVYLFPMLCSDQLRVEKISLEYMLRGASYLIYTLMVIKRGKTIIFEREVSQSMSSYPL